MAVKISTGETGSNYLRPELIGDLVASVHGTIVECNTAYGGQRANTAYAPTSSRRTTDIRPSPTWTSWMRNGSLTLPVEGGAYLAENYVGANLANYDYIVVLSHFKGHSMAGFGGAIKNISIGIASAEGKSHIHSGGTGGKRVEREPGCVPRGHGGGGQSPSSTTWHGKHRSTST